MSTAVPHNPEPQNTLQRRQGWSLRPIGHSLGVSHVTVARYLEQAQASDSLTGAPA